MTPDEIDSAATLGGLMRILRRYASSSIGPSLGKEFAAMAEQGRAGLVALEEGSPERQLEAVLIAVHRELSTLVHQLGIEIGTEVLDARRWLEDADPDDLGGTPW